MHLANTGYTAEFFRVLKKGDKIDADEKKMGWIECVGNENVSLSNRFHDLKPLKHCSNVIASRAGITASRHDADATRY